MSADELLADPVQKEWRNEFYDAVKPDHVQAIVAFGTNAQQALDLWDGKPNVPVERVPHPSSRDAGALLQAWHGAIQRLRGEVTPDPDGHADGPELRLLVPGGRLRGDPEARPAVRRARLPRRRRSRQAGPSAAQQLGVASDPGRRPHADLERAGRLSEFLGSPVDPLDGPAFALGGRVVTMDAHDSVVEDGVVYVREGAIAAVQKANVDPPPEFEGVKVLETQGHDLPGPDRPPRPPELQRAPALGRAEAVHEPRPVGPGRHVPEARHRPDEGARAHAGVRAGDRSLRRGQVPRRAGRRPRRGSRSPATRASSASTRGSSATSSRPTRTSCPRRARTSPTSRPRTATKFLKRLESFDCLLLHLSEGTDETAREHFLALAGAERRLGDHELAGRDPLRRAREARTSTCSRRPGRRWSGRRSATCSSTGRRPT